MKVAYGLYGRINHFIKLTIVCNIMTSYSQLVYNIRFPTYICATEFHFNVCSQHHTCCTYLNKAYDLQKNNFVVLNIKITINLIVGRLFNINIACRCNSLVKLILSTHYISCLLSCYLYVWINNCTRSTVCVILWHHYSFA